MMQIFPIVLFLFLDLRKTLEAQAQQDAPFVVNGMIPLTQTSVFENPGGLGDTLLYGYYNVGGFNKFIALINTDSSNGIIGRIRFREAKASVEVLDFNICLSAGDAWCAIIYDDGTQGFISAFGSDTLTRPDIGAGFQFRHAGNGGNNITAEDTKEGYFEFIGLIRTPAEISTCPAATIGTTLNDVPNALAGGLYLVNPLSGEAYGYTATALANFQIAGITTSGIGADPDLGVNEYAHVPQNTNILAALKITGNTQSGLSLGFLESVTGKKEATIAAPAGERSQSVEPLTNFFVGRTQRDLRNGDTRLGAMLTATHRRIDDVSLDFLHTAAYTGGIDLYHSWRNKAWYVALNGTASHVRGDETALLRTQTASARYFQRPDNDYASVDSTRTSLTGHAGSLRVGRVRGAGWRFESVVAWRSPGFDINDIGFMQRADPR